MTIWPVPRALVFWLLIAQNLTLINSTDSESNPPSHPSAPSTPSTPDPGGGQSPVSPSSSTPSECSTLDSPENLTQSVSKKDDQSESCKDDKPENQLKAVMVAMDDEKSTDEFEFAKGDKTMTYTAKEGYGFNEVKWLRSKGHCLRADRNVWKTENPTDLAQKVVVKDLNSYKFDLFVHQFNGGLHVYHRPAWGSKWSYTGGIVKSVGLEPRKAENIPSTEHPKEVSVVLKGQTDSKDSEDLSNTGPNYSVHKYHIKSRILFYEFQFRDNHECTELKFEDKSVWTHDASKANQGHPKSAFVFINTKTVFLCFKEDVILVSRIDGDQWKSVFEGKPETSAVDIKSKASDTGYEYSKDDNTKIATYTAKDKHLINNVKTKELVLWTTDKVNQYGTKVEVQGIGSSQKTLSLHLLNGGIKKFNKSGDNQPWMEINPSGQINSTFSIESIPFKIKIFLKDLQDSGEDSKKFQIIKYPYNNIVSFLFNDKVSYFNIRIGNKGVDFKCSDSNFPTGFKIQGKSISIIFSDKIQLHKYNDNTHHLDKVSEEKPLEHTDLNFKLMGSEKDDGSDPKDMDSSKYKIYKFPFSYVYKFNEGVKCVEVKCKDKELWKYDEAGSKKQFPKSLIFNRTNHNMFINFDDYYLCFNTAGSVFNKIDYNFLKESECNVKFVGSEGSDSNKELSEDKFEKSVDDYVIEYQFKNAVKCSEIKFNNETLWKYEQNKHNDKYPKSLFINLYLNLITVYFNHLWYYSFYYTGNRWSLLSAFQDEAKEMITSEPEYFTGELVEESSENKSSTPSGNPSSADGSGTNPSDQSGSTTPDPGGGTTTNPASTPSTPST